MIKKLLLGLGITFLSFISFSYADFGLYKIEDVGIYLNTLGGNKITVLDDGILNSTNSGGSINKNILVFADTYNINSTNKKYFWFNNGYAYFYWYLTGNNNNFVAGKFTKYFLCDTLQSSTVFNCNIKEYGNGDNLGNFFNSISSNDKYGYRVQSTNQATLPLVVCFSSISYGASVCFDNSSDNYYDIITMEENITFDSFPLSVIGNPPGFQSSIGGNIVGGSQNVNNSNITGNVTYSTCTKQKALNYYRVQGYKDKLCYSSYGNDNDIYTGPSSVSDYSLTGTDIIDVWFDTWHLRRYGNTGSDFSYSDWFQYWRKSFEIYNSSYNSSGTVSNPFLGVPVSLFTLFGNIYSYGLAFNNESILDYCNLVLLDQDLNTPYTGLLGTIPCNYSAIDILADTYGVHAESGHVVQGSSWEGILNRSGYHLDLGRNSGSVASGSTTGLSYFGDGKSFINSSFNILSNSFRFPDRNSNGIIPNYILVFMFALVLFRFISH